MMKVKETAPRFMPPVLELHVVRRPFLPQNNPWISIFRPKIGELAVETLPANLSENSGFYSSANVETCLGANRLSRRSSAYNIKDSLNAILIQWLSKVVIECANFFANIRISNDIDDDY